MKVSKFDDGWLVELRAKHEDAAHEVIKRNLEDPPEGLRLNGWQAVRRSGNGTGRRLNIALAFVPTAKAGISWVAVDLMPLFAKDAEVASGSGSYSDEPRR